MLFLPDLELRHDIYGFVWFKTNRKYHQDPDLVINTECQLLAVHLPNKLKAELVHIYLILNKRLKL